MSDLRELLKQPGQRLSVDDWNQLVSACLANTLHGQGVQRGPDGTLLPRPRPRRGGKQPPYRFQMSVASTTSGGVTTPKVSFVPGTVDSVSPVCAGSTLDSTPAPNLELANGVKNIIVIRATFTAETTEYEGETFLLNYGVLSGIELVAYADGDVPEDSHPTREDPAGMYYCRVGYATVDGDGNILALENDGVRTSLASHYCASGAMWYSMI